jgi:hypothetical protein
MRNRILIASLLLLTTNCGNNPNESAATAISQLNSPTFAFTGSGTVQIGSTSYFLANSGGTITTSENTISAGFSDPNLPLSATSTAYSVALNTGTCTSIAVIPTSVTGTSGNMVTTQLSATGCSDQSTVNISLDTSQIYDNQGLNGTVVDTLPITVDVAPKVTTVATGDPNADGSGTPEVTPGYFSIINDNSIVATFSKNMTSGTLMATLTECSNTPSSPVTLGTPVLAAGSNGETVAWPVSGASGFPTMTTCQLNVSTVTDAVGNPDDPSDPNLNMTITFH